MNKEIYRFYRIAILDIAEGVPLEELEIYLKMYEDVEDYEACAGILKAIKETRYDTIQNIKEKKNDIR